LWTWEKIGLLERRQILVYPHPKENVAAEALSMGRYDITRPDVVRTFVIRQIQSGELMCRTKSSKDKGQNIKSYWPMMSVNEFIPFTHFPELSFSIVVNHRLV
jgi:hypothetical protein